jgi:hypothetical protein
VLLRFSLEVLLLEGEDGELVPNPQMDIGNRSMAAG